MAAEESSSPVFRRRVSSPVSDDSAPVYRRRVQPAVSEEAPKAMTAMSFTELQCAYSVMAYKLDNQQKKRQKGAGRKDKKQSDKRQKSAGDGTALPNDKCTQYCYAHGAQNSHSSSQCKVMASQPQHFTAAMRSATSSNSPPGGSTLVRGRDP